MIRTEAGGGTNAGKAEEELADELADDGCLILVVVGEVGFFFEAETGGNRGRGDVLLTLGVVGASLSLSLLVAVGKMLVIAPRGLIRLLVVAANADLLLYILDLAKPPQHADSLPFRYRRSPWSTLFPIRTKASSLLTPDMTCPTSSGWCIISSRLTCSKIPH